VTWWLQVAVYVVVGCFVAGATWYVIHTVERANLSYKLETTLEAERKASATKDALFKAVNADAVAFARDIAAAADNLAAMSKQRGKAYAKVKDPDGVCIDADLMRVLNSRTTAPNTDEPTDPVGLPREGSRTPSAGTRPADAGTSALLRRRDFEGLRSAGLEVESPRRLGRQVGGPQ